MGQFSSKTSESWPIFFCKFYGHFWFCKWYIGHFYLGYGHFCSETMAEYGYFWVDFWTNGHFMDTFENGFVHKFRYITLRIVLYRHFGHLDTLFSYLMRRKKLKNIYKWQKKVSKCP